MGQHKHTPGPWEWDAGLVPPDGPETYADIYVDGGETIIAGFNDFIPEGRANARLIAASPDLLAALEGLLALYQSQPRETTPQEIAAEYAIAKATGGDA